ncbi:MAG: hypothetical protein E7166_04850 [Firmicutes bacterium]|nr:hypothetical protein [Bacillota bacterium]
MKELIEKRKQYTNTLMEVYKKKSEEYLNDTQSILDREQGFREYMKEKISVSSFQKGLDDFVEETKRIGNKIIAEKSEFNELLNEFSLKDNDFSVAMLTNTRKNIFDKVEVEKVLKELEDEFDNEYKTIILDYTNKLDQLFEKIKKMVELNRKFVVEYGGLQLTETPVENEYKPIYDMHDQIYNKFIYEFQTEAYRINFLPQQIKSTYTRTTKLLDENYDIFSDLLNDLEQSNS